MNDRQETAGTAPAAGERPLTPYMAGANAAVEGNGNGNPYALFSRKWYSYESGYHDSMRLMRAGRASP